MLVTNAVAEYIQNAITLADTGMEVVDIVMQMNSQDGLKMLAEKRGAMGSLIMDMYKVHTRMLAPKGIDTLTITNWIKLCVDNGLYNLSDIKEFILAKKLNLKSLSF